MTATSKAARLRSRMPAIDPDAPPSPPVAAVPAPVRSEAMEPPALVDVAPEESAASETPSSVSREPSAPARRSATSTAGGGVGPTALDDPQIVPGRSGYRSFYVEDALFARFRAAIYWSSRREDADDDVPENMSVAISDYMEHTASKLEKRFNNGEVFRLTPEQRKRRKRRNESQ
jgi:hypothetical protein